MGSSLNETSWPGIALSTLYTLPYLTLTQTPTSSSFFIIRIWGSVVRGWINLLLFFPLGQRFWTASTSLQVGGTYIPSACQSSELTPDWG